MNRQKVILVLGAHRSGTSALTRSLEAMGASLGEQLLPADHCNQRGFWEDRDVKKLNQEMLAFLGRLWFGVAPLSDSERIKLSTGGFRSRIASLIKEKLPSESVMAFKDPRFAQLMHLWLDVFVELDFEASVVVALRHPECVARSLYRRNRLAIEHGYLLWASHMVQGVVAGVGFNRVVVCYDELLKEPASQMNRMSRALGLRVDETKFANFRQNFLSKELRHFVCDPNWWPEEAVALPMALELYRILQSASHDQCDLEDSSVVQKLHELRADLEALSPCLLVIDSLGLHMRQASEVIASLRNPSAERS